jgi:hypothetical protein
MGAKPTGFSRVLRPHGPDGQGPAHHSSPRDDGYEATRRSKADPDLDAISIIAASASATEGDEQKARASGCDQYVTNSSRHCCASSKGFSANNSLSWSAFQSAHCTTRRSKGGQYFASPPQPERVSSTSTADVVAAVPLTVGPVRRIGHRWRACRARDKS